MLTGCHFGGGQHSCFGLYSFEPFKTLYTYTFKASGLGARFPYTGTEYLDAVASQLAGGVHYLFLGFGAARTSYYQRVGHLYSIGKDGL